MKESWRGALVWGLVAATVGCGEVEVTTDAAPIPDGAGSMDGNAGTPDAGGPADSADRQDSAGAYGLGGFGVGDHGLQEAQRFLTPRLCE